MDTYQTIGELIMGYLLERQLESGVIWDEHRGDIAPDNGYQNTFFALGCVQMHHRRREEKWISAARKALWYFRGIPRNRRGHLEFNNLAVVLLLTKITKLDVLDSPDYQWIEAFCKDYVSDLEFRVRPYGGMSNNWLAMRSATHALVYAITGEAREMKMARKLMRNHILGYQLGDGFFYDYPNDANADNFSTPLTYHAKICLMLAFFLESIWDCDVLKALVNGLDVLSHFIAPSGQAFYFGRTNNGLFGYAAAIYAYELLASLLSTSDSEKALHYHRCAQRLLRFITRYQCLDGHVRIVPNSLEELRCGWDEYMHTTIYNAYAAAMLLLTAGEEPPGEEIEQIDKSDTSASCYYASSAGL
jgi:hypothetical protein